MIAPLMPNQVEQALSHGSQAELDEFNRLVEKLHMEDFAPNLVTDFDRNRLQQLKGKLFPGKMATAKRPVKVAVSANQATSAGVVVRVARAVLKKRLMEAKAAKEAKPKKTRTPKETAAWAAIAPRSVTPK